jgi:hypothetical protein
MKNIHLIPTDKLSRLALLHDGKLHIGTYWKKDSNVNPQNIYITSDEEIKDKNCWVTNGVEIFKPSDLPEYSLEYANRNWEKIILTTDQDLIADGVQAIDDKFLEWFVKNPSCEEVKIGQGYFKNNYDLSYKIIIPKEEPNPFELPKALPDDVFYQSLEEPKQDTVGKVFFESADKVITVKRQEKKPHSFCETPEEKCTMNYCDENGCQNRVRHLVEQKQHLIDLMRLDEEQQTFIKPDNVDGQWLSPVPTERAWQEEKLVEIFEHYPNASPKWQYMNGLIQNSLDAKEMYSEEELKSWLVHRDLYLYNYYTTYIKSGIPLQSVEDFIKEHHEYLMDRKQFKKK